MTRCLQGWRWWWLMLLAGCSTLEQTARHGFENGRYRQTTAAGISEVYLEVGPDSITLYPLQSVKPLLADMQQGVSYSFKGSQGPLPPSLRKRSLDLDLSAALLKYRFQESGVPNQLNSQLNVNLYGGWRHDYFSFSDHQTPTRGTERRMKHFQFDVGLFAGLGVTPINPTVTNGGTSLEYDGIIFQKGIAAFFGIRQLTAGVCLGWDNLLDPNHSIWLYQQQPWIGMMIGINLGE